MNQQQAKSAYSGVAQAAFFDGAATYGEVLTRMSQHDIVFFDFETTGLNYEADPDSEKFCGRPVQIGLVRIRKGECVGQFNEFMNPEHELSQWSKENLLNSEGKELTDDWLRDQPPWNEVLERALGFIDDCPIVGGQNCQFDIGVMLHSLRRKKMDGTPNGTAIGESRWKVKGHVDSLYITQVIMAQAIAAHQPIVLPDNYKLKTLHEHFGLGPFLAHDAAADSLASWRVMCAALDRHRDMQLLSQEQAQFLEQALQGNSMFITGGAGTGKSFLLRIIVEVMKMRGKHCAVLSPTGVASLNVKGATINSFFGIGIPIKWHDFINIQKPEKNRNLTLLTQQDTQDSHKTKITIVLDEISMVSAEMLDLIDANVRAAREEPGKPFGGLQILMFGDFFQLPPVVTQSNGDLQHPLTNGDLQHPFTNAGFAFESHFWNELQPHFCSLQKSYRQEDKSPFFEALNRIRVGELNEDDKKMLTQPKSAPSTALVPATKLFSLTHGVQHANDIELQKLPGTEVKFRATDTPGVPKNMQPPAELRLKIGARVMLVKNLDPSRGLVNGACGTVEDFLPLRTPTLPFPHPAPPPNPCKLYVSNINVDTTSKSLEEVFAPYGTAGTATVSLPVDKENPARQNRGFGFVTCRDAASAQDAIQRTNGQLVDGRKISVAVHQPRYPSVRFDGMEQPITMGPERFDVKSDDCSRREFKQVPLTLAWAISIHKSQGLSLSNLEVSGDGVWEEGQLYVALSRARTLEGLTVHSLRDGVCKANPKVLAFYDLHTHLQPPSRVGGAGEGAVTLWIDRATIVTIRSHFKAAAAAAAAAATVSAAPIAASADFHDAEQPHGL